MSLDGSLSRLRLGVLYPALQYVGLSVAKKPDPCSKHHLHTTSGRNLGLHPDPTAPSQLHSTSPRLDNPARQSRARRYKRTDCRHKLDRLPAHDQKLSARAKQSADSRAGNLTDDTQQRFPAAYGNVHALTVNHQQRFRPG
jgi:hypothetical protein